MIFHTFVVRSVIRDGKESKSSSIMHLLNIHRYVFHENATFHENAIFHEKVIFHENANFPWKSDFPWECKFSMRMQILRENAIFGGINDDITQIKKGKYSFRLYGSTVPPNVIWGITYQET